MYDDTIIHAQVRELESIISSHPGVEDVVVISLKNSKGEHIIQAFVEPAEDTPPSEQSIINTCHSKSKYGRVPEAVIFGEIPRTPSGKVARHRLMTGSAI